MIFDVTSNSNRHSPIMIKLLFVCLGNICRSPSAEAVMNTVIEKADLEEKITCQSAGTYGGHAGAPADSRMRVHASKRGYDLTSRSEQIKLSDLDKYDYIIVMDDSNYQDVLSLDKSRKFHQKVVKMTDFATEHSYDSVPDPYYGGSKGFELVLDLLEDACNGLLNHLRKEL